MTYARLCEHGEVWPHKGTGYVKDRQWITVNEGIDCPGGSVLPDDTLVKAWIGDSSVEEVQDLVWDDHAHVIDVSGMDPVWVIPRDLDALAAASKDQA